MKERIELANNPSSQKGNVEFEAAEREHKGILENLTSKKNEHEAAKVSFGSYFFELASDWLRAPSNLILS